MNLRDMQKLEKGSIEQYRRWEGYRAGWMSYSRARNPSAVSEAMILSQVKHISI